MIKNIFMVVVIVAISATVAYQMGWLSYKGEDAYEIIEESVKDTIDR